MSKLWKSFKNIVSKCLWGTESKHEECFVTFKELVRNSEHSKSEKSRNFQYWPKFLVSYEKYVYT